MSGVLSKAGFRIEGSPVSGTGLASSSYPNTPTEADAEEVKLGQYDQLPILSETLKQSKIYGQDDTYNGESSTPGIDLIERRYNGTVELLGMFEGLTSIIAAAMGFEYPGTDSDKQYPDFTVGTNEIESTVQSATSTTITAPSQIFGSDQVGQFVYLYGNQTSASQIRRITAVNGVGDEITVTPAFDVTPSLGDTYIISGEFEHFFEMSNHLSDQKWIDIYSSYPTAGVLTVDDKIIRRGTYAINKNDTIGADVFRSVMIDTLQMQISSGGAMSVSADMVAFDENYESSTNLDLDDLDFTNREEVNQAITFDEVKFYIAKRDVYYELTDSDLACISDFNISLNNSLKQDDFTYNSVPYISQPTRAARREVTGSFRIPRYESDTFKEWSNEDDEFMLKVVCSGPSMDSVDKDITIWLPRVRLKMHNDSVQGSSALTQTVDFQALSPDELYQPIVFDDARLDADSPILNGATDFEIEFEINNSSFPNATFNIPLGSQVGGSGTYISVNSNGTFINIYNGTTSQFPSNNNNPLLLGVNYKIIIVKIGDDLSIRVNDDVKYYSRLAGYYFDCGVIGARLIGQFPIDARIKNLKVWSGGDRNTGTLVCDLVGKDDEAIDLSGTHTFTESVASGGSITYEDALYSPEDFPEQYIENPRSEMQISMKNRYPWNPLLGQNREY